MAFWDLKNLELAEFRPGIMSKAEIGENVIMVCMEIAAGKEDAGHQHPFDQCGVILDGQMEMFIGDERTVIETGQAYFIPSGAQHGWKALDKAVTILDISAKQP